MLRQAMSIAIVLSIAGCEKTDHPTIEKWGHTQKGPEKLAKTLADESIDADLSAHAAAVMLKKGGENDVKGALDAMSQGRKAAVVKALAVRVWEAARIEKEMDVPRGDQIAAKDQLFMLRKYADPETLTVLDGYLLDWYAVPSYERRAGGGAYIGPKVIRAIGPAAGKKMISAMNSLVAGPKNRIKDELLLGLAATGDPEAVKYLLDIAVMERNPPDPTLPDRATDALMRAFVKNDSLFDVAPAEPALGPNIDQLAALVKNEKVPGHTANNAVDLIRAVGAPKCLKPLVEMVGYPHKEEDFLYMAAQNSMVCGGSKAIQEIVRAIPEGSYEGEKVVDAIVRPMAALPPKPVVVAAVRELLDDPKVISKWIAVEAVGVLNDKESAAKVAALGKDGRKLTGYWGDQSGAATKKPDPTLGDRAKAIGEKLAKP